MFAELSPWANAAAFAVAAFAVWRAGARLAGQADEISRRTGLGSALLGIVLLGGITSLPELAVAVTATLSGNPVLSVNDVLGSAAINVVLLAVADAVYGRRALTVTPGTPEVMLQGVLGIVMLSLLVGPTIAGDRTIAGLGAWSWAVLVAYAASAWIVSHARGLRSWRPTGGPADARGDASSDDRTGDGRGDDARGDDARGDDARGGEARGPAGRLAAATAATAAVILVAGFVLARSGDALAEQTGLGESFFGAVLLGASTSLPEVSTVLAAVRLRRYTLAISDVFGTNLFNVAIVVLVDALHPGGPVLLEAGPFAAFGALLAIVLTAVYLVGMIERRDRTVLRMGIDSIVAIGCYAAGVVVLYGLR